MDSERPIEKLLRQTARRRQAQAGDRFEPHPADRRSLQAEVARHYPASAARTAGGSSWLQLWPRLAWAVGLLAVLGIIVWVVLPHRLSLDKDLTLAQAPSAKPDAIPPAPTVPAPSRPAPGAPAAMPLKSREARGGADATPLQTDEFHPPVIANEVKTESPKPAVADSYSARMEADSLAAAPSAPPPSRSLYGDNRGMDALGSAKVATLPPTSPAPAVSTAEEIAAHSFGVRLTAQTPAPKTLWVRTKPDAEARAVTPTAADSMAILSSFSVEQSGNEIRVVDYDGSVYVGSLSPSPASPVLADATLRDNRLDAESLSAPRPRRGVTGSAPAQTADSVWHFQVAGTNRTLKQSVVFSWNLVTNAIPGRPSRGLPAATPAEVQQQREGGSPQPPLRISGRVILENGKVIPINATPAGAQ